MSPLHRVAPLLLVLLAAAPPPRTVELAAQRGTPLDAVARQLVAQDLAEAARRGDEPLLLLGTARLGAARDQPALFVQLQSPLECGSAGCNTQVYAWVKGAYVRVLDGVSGTVTVAPTRHRGMADLRVGADRYVWNGAKYEDVRPAPPVNLRPRG